MRDLRHECPARMIVNVVQAVLLIGEDIETGTLVVAKDGEVLIVKTLDTNPRLGRSSC